MDLLRLLEGLRTPFFDVFFSVVTRLGEETLFTVVAIVFFWCVDKRKGYYLLYVGLLGNIVNQFLKMLFCIPRPWLIDPKFTIVESARSAATGYSFPSGHTQSIGGTGFSIACFAKKRFVRILCIATVLIVAFSRMYLGVHTPLDVGVSLLSALLIALGLYPAFRRANASPRVMAVLLAGLTAVSVGFVLYAALVPFPANAIPEYSAHGVKNAYTMLGTVLGLGSVYFFERRFVQFDERAPLWAQLLKSAVGLGLVMGLRILLKNPLLALTGGHEIAHAIRYFLMLFAGGGLYPMLFRFLPKTTKMQADAPSAEAAAQ